MAVEFRDYYSTLGVSRTASADEIKKAFRKLARVYHPDIAKDKKTAEAKFKEINEAHEVLGDPAKRKKYDELGPDWQQGGRPPPAGTPGWHPGSGSDQEFHFGGTGFSDFFEQYFGGGRAGGSGGFDEMFRHGRQGSPNQFAGQAARGPDIEGDILVTLDEVMHGATRSLTLRKRDARRGETESESFTVRIPPGAQDGRRIRVPGKGHPGQGGGEAGDLFLRVRIAGHPDFEVRGTDLYHELALAPWEAALGAHVVVPTLSGSIKLRVPAGTNSGRELRIRGHGLPQGRSGERGDLYAVASIQVPMTSTDEERALWEQLQKASKFNPRAG